MTKILIFCFNICEVVVEIHNNFIANIKTNCCYNTDFIKINIYLSYYKDCFKSRGYKFSNINQMTINIISDRCNMTYKHYMDQPMSTFERKMNMNFAGNPELINGLDRNKNHPLI